MCLPVARLARSPAWNQNGEKSAVWGRRKFNFHGAVGHAIIICARSSKILISRNPAAKRGKFSLRGGKNPTPFPRCIKFRASPPMEITLVSRFSACFRIARQVDRLGFKPIVIHSTFYTRAARLIKSATVGQAKRKVLSIVDFSRPPID